MNKILTIQAKGKTDVGKARTGNEDRFYCGPVWEDRYRLALVIDGCGGHLGGEQAAQMTHDEILKSLNEHKQGDAAFLLKAAMIVANNKVHEARRSNENLREMCCVATAALIDLQQEKLYMAHVGDTRLYAACEGRIIKLSHDHSPVGRDEEQGFITETQAMNHHHRNIIERAIGEKRLDKDTTYIETDTFPLSAGITYMLCSDGLCDMITSAQMSDILHEDTSVSETVDKLIEAANEAGGKDNITVAVLRIEGENTSDAASIMEFYATKMSPEKKVSFRSLSNFNITNVEEAQPKEQEKPAVQEKPEVVNEPVPEKEQKEDKSKEKVLDDKASKLPDVQENTPDKGASPEKEGAAPKDEQKIEQVKQSDETSTAMSQAAANKGEEQAKQTEAAPKCHSERIEETDDITQEKKSERSEAKRNSSFFTFHTSLKLISFIACWILLAIGVVLGIYAYQAHKQKVIEERNEIIRQEIYRRQLQDSIKSLQDSILHLTAPMNAKDTLTAPDSIPSR